MHRADLYPVPVLLPARAICICAYAQLNGFGRLHGVVHQSCCKINRHSTISETLMPFSISAFVTVQLALSSVLALLTLAMITHGAMPASLAKSTAHSTGPGWARTPFLLHAIGTRM
jgi:hypothetical protein